MAELYGYTNKVMAKLKLDLLNNQDLMKFLYYTDTKDAMEEILTYEDVYPSEVMNKKFYMYKRIEDVIRDAGAYMFIDLYRLTPIEVGGNIREVTFTIDILVHKDCQDTIYGNRAICIETAIENSLCDWSKSIGIGKVDLVRVAPILGLVKDFGGYALQFKAYGFKDRLRK